MVTGSGHGHRFPSGRLRINCALDRSRILPRERVLYPTRVVGTILLIAGGLVFPSIFPAIGKGLLMWAAGAALAFLLQDVVDPTPLFWTVPWEAMQLLFSRSVRVNHIWLHRSQELARESLGVARAPGGFATGDGFVLLYAGHEKEVVEWTANLAWRTMSQEASAHSPSRGCKAIRFLIALWLIAGGTLALAAWRGLDLGTAVLIVLICSLAGHALAKPLERRLGLWFTRSVCCGDDAVAIQVQVERFEVPAWLWWQGVQGFRVRRMPAQESNGD